jgi:hypothetical protein
VRADLFAVFVSADLTGTGRLDALGEFDDLTGGDITVDATTRRRPGDRFARNRGGLAEIDDVEVTREWQPGRDDVIFRALKDRPNTLLQISQHNRQGGNGPIEIVAFRVYTGPLVGLVGPEYDSQSGDTPVLGLTLGVDGAIG